MPPRRRFITAYREAGDADPRQYLSAFTGVDRAELGARIDRFLADAPPRAYDAEAFAAFVGDPDRQELVERVLDDTSLSDIRRQASLSKADVAKHLAQCVWANRAPLRPSPQTTTCSPPIGASRCVRAE